MIESSGRTGIWSPGHTYGGSTRPIRNLSPAPPRKRRPNHLRLWKDPGGSGSRVTRILALSPEEAEGNRLWRHYLEADRMRQSIEYRRRQRARQAGEQYHHEVIAGLEEWDRLLGPHPLTRARRKQMSLIARAPKFVVPDEGWYSAICTKVEDLGVQDWSKGREMVRITFTLEGGDEVGQLYTNSLFESANLRKMLEQWLGRSLTDDEINGAGYDLATLEDRGARIRIKHHRSEKGTIRARIPDVLPEPELAS